jgi:hypothetical protein
MLAELSCAYFKAQRRRHSQAAQTAGRVVTILLGRRGDPFPYTCSVCGRSAGPFGTCGKHGDPIAWLCTDPTCIKIAGRVYNMKKLDRYEETAIADAGGKVLDALFEAFLGRVLDHGIRDLNALDEKAFAAIAEKVRDGDDYHKALATFLGEYGASIKRQFDNNDPPF